jgi:hypothetical protein
VPELSDEFVREKFAHIYEQYFDRFEIRRDGEGNRYIHAEYSHPRFKRTWVPIRFSGLRVHCVPTEESSPSRKAETSA